MSAKSRSKHRIDLPLRRGDYIIVMTTVENVVLVKTAQGRRFELHRVARYKRPYKVREVTSSATP